MAEEKDSEKRLRSVMDKLFPSPKSNPFIRNTKSAEVTKRGNSASNGFIAESSNFSGGNLVAFGGSKRSTVLVESSSSPETPLCRPWDRGDLIRRLSTFKSMTWFAKPKVVSAVSCARRGWINVEMDIIACEACGARLLFSTPASWTQQQVEKAAAVFSLKLNDGHRLLCPWIDNACDETLVHFPPTPAPALVDSYRKRFAALLQLSALPVISSSTIDRMRSPQLEHFLENSSMPGRGNGTVQPGRIDYLHNEHEVVSANLYYQALKLISLCGWVPRSLPYMVDCGNPSSQSAGVRSKDLFPQVITGQNSGIILHPASSADEAVKVNDDHSPLLRQSDPASVVLDCKLCGASVGLWAFSTVPQPLEYIRLVESSEGDRGCITRNSGTDHSINENNSGRNGGGMDGAIFKERSLGLNLSIAGGPPPAKQNYRAKVSLPIISRYLRTGLSSDFNIRDHNINSMSSTDHSIPPSDLPNTNSLQQDKDHITPCSQIIESDDMRSMKLQKNEIEPSFLSWDGQSCLNHEFSEAASKRGNENLIALEGRSSREQGVLPEQAVGTFSDSSIENQTESTDDMLQLSGRNNNSHEYDQSVTDAKMSDTSFQVRECLATSPDANGRVEDRLTSQDNSIMDATETFPQQLNKDLYGSGNEDTSETTDGISSDVTCLEMNTNVETACKMDFLNADKGFDFGKSSHMQGTNQEVKGMMPTVQPAINNGIAEAHGFGRDLPVTQSDPLLVFDPIAQHRHFCPWIESNGSAACGWQLTLSALHRERDCSHLFPGELPNSSSLEVDDPIASVRKLFTSPPSKRKKTS